MSSRATLLTVLALTISPLAAEPIALQLGEPEPLPRQLHAFNSNLLTATANNYLWREDTFSLQYDDRTEWAAQQLALVRKIGRKYDLPGYARIETESLPAHKFPATSGGPGVRLEPLRNRGIPIVSKH